MKHSLRYFGDPVLRKIASPVPEVNHEVKEFVKELIHLMDEHNGIGLAATQIGKLWRVFVIRLEFIGENGEFQKGQPKVFINPKLSNPSEEMEIMNEGCLSLPKIFVDVPRPTSIQVEALDENGKSFSQKFKGFTARQIMHENDHLNGTLIIDRCSSAQKSEAKPFLAALKKKYKKESLL